jgi:hypothetical protein
MPDLKYLYRVLYIAFINKLLIFFLTKLTIKSYILIVEYSSVVTIAKWLDAGEHLGHLKDLEISKYERLFSLERP